MEVVTTAEKVTVPVKPLIAAAAMVTGGMVPPAATETDAEDPDIVNPVPLGVRLKSGQEEAVTCTSTGLVSIEPLDVTPAPPVSPAPAASSAR